METSRPESTKIVWDVSKGKKHKPIHLRVGAKQKDFFTKDIKPGIYTLILHTTDSLPGGEKGPRYIGVDLRIFSENRDDYLVREIYKLHSKNKTEIIEFTVEEEQSPVSIKLHVQCHSPFPLGMKFIAKLLKDVGVEEVKQFGEDLGAKIDTQPFLTMTFEEIKDNLRRHSEFRDKAYDLGMIRPFLYLVSMHRATRKIIADVLGIEFIKNEKTGTFDPHEEAYEMISNGQHGIEFHTNHSYESVNPATHTSWYDSIKRATKEVFPKENVKQFKDYEFHDSKRISNEPWGEEIFETEHLLLHNIAETIHDAMKKEYEKEKEDFDKGKRKKEPIDLIKKAEILLQNPEIEALIERLKKNGIRDPEIHRFLVELCLEIHKQFIEQIEESNEFRKKVLAKEAKVHGYQDPEKQAEEELSRFKENIPYGLDDVALLNALRNQLLDGSFDPRSVSQKGWGYAQKGGKFAAQQAFKYFILIPLFPVLAPFWPIWAVFHFFTKANHEKVFMAAVQLLLQKLLLASHDISIDDYLTASEVTESAK